MLHSAVSGTTTSWTLMAYSLSTIIALVVCLIVTAVLAPFLRRRGRDDLLPWVVGVSLGLSLFVSLVLLLPRLTYVVVR